MHIYLLVYVFLSYVIRTAKFWRPLLRKKVLYSEILDRYMEIVVSTRTLNMIDEAFGFDFYILKVRSCIDCSRSTKKQGTFSGYPTHLAQM